MFNQRRHKYFLIAFCIFFSQIIVDSSIANQTTKSPEEDKSATGKEKNDEIIKATDIVEWIALVKGDNEYDLNKIAIQLPLIFNSKEAKLHYFESDASAVTEWGIIDNNVHAREIERLSYALIDYSLDAAKRKDWIKCRAALLLAIDVYSLPIELIPPDQVSFWGGEAKPGKDFKIYAWRPSARGLREVKIAVSAIADLTPRKEDLIPLRDRLGLMWEEVKNQLSKVKSLLNDDAKRTKWEDSVRNLLREDTALDRTKVDQSFQSIIVTSDTKK